MGIDIYARWKNQTEEEKDKQITGFSIVSGNVGYLREAYHGEPYATHYFVAEAFADHCDSASISANVLLDRLPETLKLVRQRAKKVYREKDEYEIFLAQKSFVDFAMLCEQKEKETGEPCLISASY